MSVFDINCELSHHINPRNRFASGFDLLEMVFGPSLAVDSLARMTGAGAGTAWVAWRLN